MPEKTIEDLELDVKSEHDLYLRALADFDNYRRRIDRERDKLGTESLRRFLTGLLDVVDDIERFLVLIGEEESNPFINGIQVVREKLLALLEKEGVRPFDSLGKPFDPAVHEVAATQPAGDEEPGIVAVELRRGYMFRDELLRAARVVVTT